MIWIILFILILAFVITGGKPENKSFKISEKDLKKITKNLRNIIFTDNLKGIKPGGRITLQNGNKKIEKKIKTISFYKNLTNFVEEINPINFDKTKSRDEILDEAVENFDIKKGIYVVSFENVM